MGPGYVCVTLCLCMPVTTCVWVPTICLRDLGVTMDSDSDYGVGVQRGE